VETLTQQAPLANLKVLDFTHYRAGPYCTRLFSGFGARVIKVERPLTGDPLRHQGPFVDDVPGCERSIPFHWSNAGKQSIAIDLKSPEALEIVSALIRWADVIVESFTPGVMKRLGFDYARCSYISPRVIMTSISNFGQDGPYRDYRASESTMYAMSGGMISTGDPDRPPLAPGPAITQYTAGLHAYIGTLLACLRRANTGRGEYVDVSVHESALENIEIHLTEFAQEGRVARRSGDNHPLVPWRSYSCRDGYAAIIAGPLRHWHRAAELFEEPKLGAPRLQHMRGRIERRHEVEMLIQPWLDAHDKQDIYHRGQAMGLAFGYVATLAEVLASPQHAARSFFVQSDEHPEAGSLRQCGAPFKFGGGTWNSGRAPLLGEHTKSILVEIAGCSEDEMERLAQRGVI